MIPTDEIVFIRAACRHTDRPAVIVRGLDRDNKNPAWPGYEGPEAFPVRDSFQAGWYRVVGRTGFRYTFEHLQTERTQSAFLRFPKTSPTKSENVG